MKTISLWFGIFAIVALIAPRAPAQDSATQQQLDQLSGQIQSIQDSLTAQDKRITALESKISDMEDKVNQPGGNNYASADDLKNLAQQVQEIDKKRQEDNQKILKAIQELGKGGGGHAEPLNITPNTSNTGNTATSGGAGGQQNGYNYTIQQGNTLSAIAKAYRAQGIKVTVSQIEAANPGLTPNNLIVGKTIFIPAPQ